MGQLAESIRANQDKWKPVLALRGIGKDFYAGLGGAERVIQEERAEFRDSVLPGLAGENEPHVQGFRRLLPPLRRRSIPTI